MTCLSGPECGLCFTRTDPAPLRAHEWRTLLSELRHYERSPEPTEWRGREARQGLPPVRHDLAEREGL